MEKAESTGRSAGGRWGIPLARCVAAAAVACAACPGLHAEDGTQDVVVAQAQAEQGVRVEVQASTLPRLESHESGFQAPRVDVTLFPATSPHFGAVVGMSGFSPRRSQPLGLQPSRPSVDLGVRFSQRVQSRQVDITAWRRMGPEEDLTRLSQVRPQPVYGARVEMNLRPRHSAGPLFIEGGYIGMQLEGGANIAVKRNNGAPMLYYRTSF